MGSGFSKVVLVIASFVCSNLLTQAEFGEFSFIRNTLNLILVICGLNYASICTKFATEAKNSEKAKTRLLLVFLFSVFLCVSIGLLLYFLPNELLIKWFKGDSVVHYFRIIGLMLPIFILHPLFEGVLRGYMKFKLIGIFQSATSVFFLLAVYCGIYVNGYQGAIAGMIIYYAICSLFMIPFVINSSKKLSAIRHHFKTLRSELSIIKTIIIPIFLTSFIEAPVSWLSQLILMHSSSYSEIASMTAIAQIKNLAILIPSYFFGTFIAFAGRMNAEKNYKEYFTKFNQIGLQITVWGLVLSFSLILFGKSILRLYGPEYPDDYTPYIISICGITLSLRSSLLKISLVIREYQQALLINSIVWSVSWLIILYAMIEFTQISPLNSYFISLFIAIVIQYLDIQYIYYKDKQKIRKQLI